MRLSLAKAEESRRDWPLVVKTCQVAENVGIVTGPPLAFQGEAYLRERKPDQAAAAKEKASCLDPTDIDNLYNLGTVYLGLQHPRRAGRSFQSILALDSCSAPAYEGLALGSLERHDIPAAVQDFRKAVTSDPNDLDPLLELVLLCQQTGNDDQALRYLEMFLKKVSPKIYGRVIPRVRSAVRDLSHRRCM